VVEKGLLDAKTWGQVQAAALAIFTRGQAVAARAGLILVDTKYEFGRASDGRVFLIDEVHTPDSSRFWKADTYAECCVRGDEPENFDKEFVRLAFAERGYRGDGIFSAPNARLAGGRAVFLYRHFPGAWYRPFYVIRCFQPIHVSAPCYGIIISVMPVLRKNTIRHDAFLKNGHLHGGRLFYYLIWPRKSSPLAVIILSF
jgi:hypothetical protein